MTPTLGWTALAVFVVSSAACTSTPPTPAAARTPEATIAAIAREIEALRGDYPQLQAFSVAAHARPEELRITYGHATRDPSPTGGWSSGVPAPEPNGIWFHLDFHPADSPAELHRQPMVAPLRFRELAVTLLIREGEATRRVEAELHRILARYGIEPDREWPARR